MSSPIVSPAEILLGGVYIWGNPQLCFPDPQNITWRDTLDEQNIHAKQHRLQPRAPKCEQLIELLNIPGGGRGREITAVPMCHGE